MEVTTYDLINIKNTAVLINSDGSRSIYLDGEELVLPQNIFAKLFRESTKKPAVEEKKFSTSNFSFEERKDIEERMFNLADVAGVDKDEIKETLKNTIKNQFKNDQSFRAIAGEIKKLIDMGFDINSIISSAEVLMPKQLTDLEKKIFKEVFISIVDEIKRGEFV